MLRILIKRKLYTSSKVIQLLSTVLISILLTIGCNEGEKAPDVSGIKVDLKTYRFDKDMVAIDTNNMSGGLQQLQQKYPDFLNFFLDTLIGFDIRRDYSNYNPGVMGVRHYLTQKDYRGLFDTVDKHFPDTKEQDDVLTKGFRYLKYYYPDYKVPKVIYTVSWLNNWAAFTYGDVVGVGLDMFLGPEYPFYKSKNIPEYLGNKLKKEYMPVAVFRAIYEDHAPFQAEGSNLLDMMIQRGKELYYLGKVLPFVDEHIRLGYTQQQTDWCNKNEAMIYNFFIHENLLYDNNWQKILRYVNDGPTSTGMPAESPGDIGSWVGLQIVKAYMKEHAKMTLSQLVAENKEPQQFLLESKYKPK